MLSYRFYLNFKPKNKSNSLRSLPSQDLKAIYKLTQKVTLADGTVSEPVLFFAGTKGQKPKAHFKLFKNYYNASNPAVNHQPIQPQELLQRFSIGFDSNPENEQIWKWEEWTQKNPNYDPSNFVLEEGAVEDIDEELLNELPIVDGGDCPSHSHNIAESLLQLTQSYNDNDDLKQEDENDDQAENTEEINQNDQEISNEQQQDGRADPSQQPEMSPLQRNALISAREELKINVNKFMEFRTANNLSIHQLQLATLNICSHYLSYLAYYSVLYDDEIVTLLAKLENKSKTNEFVQSVAARYEKCKQDLIKKKIISASGAHLKPFAYVLDANTWGITISYQSSNTRRRRRENNNSENPYQPSRQRVRFNPVVDQNDRKEENQENNDQSAQLSASSTNLENSLDENNFNEFWNVAANQQMYQSVIVGNNGNQPTQQQSKVPRQIQPQTNSG